MKSQVVAGTNYWFKVDVGNGEYLFVKVFKPLPYTGNPPELVEVEQGKSDGDEF